MSQALGALQARASWRNQVMVTSMKEMPATEVASSSALAVGTNPTGTNPNPKGFTMVLSSNSPPRLELSDEGLHLLNLSPLTLDDGVRKLSNPGVVDTSSLAG